MSLISYSERNIHCLYFYIFICVCVSFPLHTPMYQLLELGFVPSDTWVLFCGLLHGVVEDQNIIILIVFLMNCREVKSEGG